MKYLTSLDYKCRRCGEEFVDPKFPEFVTDKPLTVLDDSVYRNPVSKLRNEPTVYHYCSSNVVGVADIIGYRTTVVEHDGVGAKTLTLVKTKRGETKELKDNEEAIPRNPALS